MIITVCIITMTMCIIIMLLSPIVASLVVTTCKLHSLFGTLVNCIMWTCYRHALPEQSCKFSMLINCYIRCDNWPMIATCQSSWRCLFWGNMEGYNVLLTQSWPMERTDQWGTSSPRPREVFKDMASWVSQCFPGWVPHY